MKRKRRIRSTYSFAITLVAALAFLVGAVRIWGIPANEVTDTLVTALILVAGLALLALVAVVTVKLVKHWLGR